MGSISQARHVTRFHRDHHALYAALRPAATIAVVRSASFPRTNEEFRGVYQALQQKHLPFDVLPFGALTSAPLDRYRLVVLPDVGPVGPNVAKALDEFVARGGNLLSTGNSGFTADGGAELASSPALRRIGAELSGKELWSTYATLDDQPRIDENAFVGSVVPIVGTNARCVWKPGITKAGTMLAQAPWGPPELSYGHTATGDPAVASAKHGSGMSSMITWTIGRTYREFAKTEVRDHLLRVLEPLAGVRVSAELPEQVELILGRDEDGYVVHLLNQTGARRRSFGPHVPITGGRLVIRGAAGQVTALVAGCDLPARQEEGTLVIDLPTVDLFEVVRVRHPQEEGH